MGRVAYPWRIKRFIDPQAECVFVAAAEVMTVAEQAGASPDVELGHVDGRCSFESIMT